MYDGVDHHFYSRLVSLILIRFWVFGNFIGEQGSEMTSTYTYFSGGNVEKDMPMAWVWNI